MRNIVGDEFPFGNLTRSDFDAAIADLTRDRALTAEQFSQLTERLWAAYRSWGIAAGHLAVSTPPLPEDLTPEQLAAVLVVIESALRYAISAYRAAVFKERIELEIALLV